MPAPTCPKIRAAVLTEYASGISSEDVAAKYGVSGSSVLAWARQEGIEVRSRGKLQPPEGPYAYAGGWVVRGGVSYPLYPMPRGVGQ